MQDITGSTPSPMHAATGRRKPSPQRLAAISAAGILIVLVWLIRVWSPAGTEPADSDPAGSAEAVIAGMLDSARQGDVDAWLNCFTGPAREEAETRIAAAGRQQFGAQLQRNALTLRSYVLSDWTRHNDRSVSLLFEQVFADRHETTRLTLTRESGRWRILEQTRLDEFAPAIPPGTPVIPESVSP